MALIVQKYGGTSMGSTERIAQVAKRVAKWARAGHQVVVVPSAMSGETNRLLALAKELAPGKLTQDYFREQDMLAATGEQASSALLAIALQAEGMPAVSYAGWQVPIKTSNAYTKARIDSIDDVRVRADLNAGKVVIITGFQGVDEGGNITTLGRGGSDTSAVAVAAALKADEALIFTDVDGVYTTDPRIVPEAHELRLHVGGKARVFGGAKALPLERAAAQAAHVDGVRLGAALAVGAADGLDLGTGVAQLLDHGVEVVRAGVLQRHVAAAGRHGAQEGAGLDAVGHHLVLAAAQALHALDANAAAAVAFDLRAHLDEHLGQVDDLGLLRGVFQNGFALGQAGGHEEVLGAGHRDHVGGDARALQARGAVGQARDHVAVLHVDQGAHGLQALDVLVDRARADGAAARQRHPRVAETRQQRAQRQHRGAHGLDQLVRRFAVGFGVHAHVVEQAPHGAHVVQARHVGQQHRLVGQQGGAHLGQRGVLGAGDGQLALQRPPAADQEFVHRNQCFSIKTDAGRRGIWPISY